MPRDLLADKSVATYVQERVDLFQEYLSGDIGEPVVLEFDMIPVDMITVIGKRAAPQAAVRQADK
jgi:hypothetical protein